MVHLRLFSHHIPHNNSKTEVLFIYTVLFILTKFSVNFEKRVRVYMVMNLNFHYILIGYVSIKIDNRFGKRACAFLRLVY